MGLLSGFFGHASEIDSESLEEEFTSILIAGEQIEQAYKLIRDLIVFTNKRIIFVDKQGMTGKKTEYQSVPYRSIVMFAKETAGHLDFDSELKIWVHGQPTPIKKQFKKDTNIQEIHRVLSEHILS